MSTGEDFREFSSEDVGDLTSGVFKGVEAVPKEVATVAEIDAVADDAPLVPDEESEGVSDIDVSEIRTHQLNEGKEVKLNVAAFAIMSVIKAQGRQEDGWFRDPAEIAGIVAPISDSAGLYPKVAKAALELLDKEELIEIDTKSDTNKKTIIKNARITELGGRVLEELSDFYTPLIPRINLRRKRGIVSSRVDEIEYRVELLGEEFPEELQALKGTANIDPTALPKIIADLNLILEATEIALDEKIQKDKRERRKS